MNLSNIENLDWFKTYLEFRKTNQAYIPTPWPELNALIDGFYQESLVVVGARPANGKTTLVLNMVHSLMYNHPIVVFSTETNKEKYVERLLSLNSSIPHKDIRTKVKDLAPKILAELPKIQTKNLTICDTTSPSPEEVEKTIKFLKPRFVVYDYFQNISLPNTRLAGAWLYAEAVTKFASLARENRLTFILTSQLKRFGDDRDNQRPILSDLKETGKLEEAAHTAILLSRKDGKMLLDIAKCKDGNTGEVLLGVNQDTGKIR